MATQPDPVRHVVGVMTGTSIDGIDAALVRIQGAGISMRATLVRHISRPLGVLSTRLRAAAEQNPLTAGDFAHLAWEFGELHARVVSELVGDSVNLDLIGIHGQTVFHQPPISWQLVNPAPIAVRFACPIVSDFRQLDLAAGGQGAPITPVADWILFRDERKQRAIINLGGFCNVTILPRHLELKDVQGYDVCACNQVLDAVARQALNRPLDEDGCAASRGRVISQAAETLTKLLNQQRAGKRSLGTGDEAAHWVNNQLQTGISPDDLAASAVHGIAGCIASAIQPHALDELVVSGGGVRNRALVSALAAKSGINVITSADLGVLIEARESMEFSILAALCADGVPITLPQVTGCAAPAPISGMWTNAHLLYKAPQ